MRLATIVGSMALAMTVSTTALAATYRVTIDGEFIQLDGSMIAFGLEDRVIPFQASFFVETDYVPPIEVPARTPIFGTASFPNDLLLVPRQSLVGGFFVTIGNTIFNSSQTMELGNTGLMFDVLLEGDLRDPTGIFVKSAGQFGTFDLSRGYICSETACNLLREGSAYSSLDGGSGRVLVSSIETRLITNSPQTAIAELTDDLLAVGLPKGATNSLLAKLGGALDKLDPYSQDRFAARTKLNAFINEVEALRDKKTLTDSTAARLIDKAAAAQTLIY